MLQEKLGAIEENFKIKFHDYARGDDTILIASGFGLGLGLMDVLTRIRYFIDIDNYRHETIDWECVGVLISLAEPKAIFLAGWYTIDDRKSMQNLKKGFLPHTKVVEYLGNDKRELSTFIIAASEKLFENSVLQKI